LLPLLLLPLLLLLLSLQNKGCMVASNTQRSAAYGCKLMHT
jgi:hypothetical protein